jgi:hypothetical protein
MKYKISDTFFKHKKQLDWFIQNFDDRGIPFGNQDRNSLKLFDLGDKKLNIKSFRVPNLINQVTYRFFRKSKAQRSYEYARKLVKMGIGTPTPIAYYELSQLLLFKKSYYISWQQDCDLTYRELTTNLNYPNHEKILRPLARKYAN